MSACDHCHAELPPGAACCTSCGAPHAARDELIGAELLGRYRVVRQLAEGGMGRVYVAEQTVGTAVRRVAIKVLRRQLGSDPQLATRFAREAETLVSLTHPNTVQLFDFGALADGTLALVMEYVQGRSLAVELAQGPLPLARVQRILSQIGGALKEAHARGIVHRDLKPDNILICDREGYADFVKVLDFGIASVSDVDAAMRTKLTQQGMMIGTPPYMSPEQFMGEPVDARSDIYSLALIAYELLSGRLPFEANTPWEWASKHMTAQPAPLPSTRGAAIGRVQARAIERALAKKPADRPASVDEFVREFAEESAPGSAHEAAPSEHGDETSPAGMRPLARSAATGALLAALAAGAVLGARALWWTPSSAKTSAMRLEPPVHRAREPDAAFVGAARAAAIGELPSAASPVPDDEPPQRSRARRSGSSSSPSTAKRTVEAPAPTASSAPLRGAPAGGDGTQPAQPAQPAQTPPAPPRQGALAGSRPPLAPAQTPSRSTPASPARQPAAREPTVRPPALPPDLQSRVDAIGEAAAKRPELALGLYQAAAARYGAQNPALTRVRGQVQQGAAQRIAELLANGRCPQAQALQRALASIRAGDSTVKLFGGRCPAQ